MSQIIRDGLDEADAAGRTRPKRRGLLKFWFGAAVLYMAWTCTLSVAPIRSAIIQAQGPAPEHAEQQRQVQPTGPLPDAPDSPAVKLGKVIGRQALIVVGPPLLALWFGWDVWFAVIGLLPGPASARRPEH